MFAITIILVGSSAAATSLGALSLAGAPVDASHPLAGKSMGQMIHEGMSDPLFEARVKHWLAEHGLDHPQPLPASAGDPVAVAKHAITQQVRAGKTVTEWVQLAKAEHLLSLQPASRARDADLSTEVARLNAAAGVPLDDAQLADVRAQADALPAEVRAPFAQLVAATADAYEAQAPIAAGIASRIPTSRDALDYMMTNAERDATLANALALVAAQNAFRLAVEDVAFPASSTALFRDPNGLVILGSLGSDTHVRDGALRDAALLVDPAGDDVYQQAAGGACADIASLIHDCNGLVVALALDLQGNDRYTYSGAPTNAQGSASVGAIGVLVDVAGHDSYLSSFVQTLDPAPFWGGVLGYIDAGVQGYGLAGAGLLVDATGNDLYQADVTSSRFSIWDFAQGFGNAGGVGIAADGLGDDQWLAYGYDGNMGGGFQGMYPGGTGLFGGLGVMTDTGLGRDHYHSWDNATTTDYYAYGFGAFGGTGIFYEDGGDDDYQAVESATNPWIRPLLNCAFGTASFAGLGVFLEMGGDDQYYGASFSPYAVATMNEGFGGPAEGEGIFLDVSGEDGHFMEGWVNGVSRPDMTYGRGIWLGGGEGALGGNTVGVYLDMGGLDAYTGAAPSRNNAVWPAGMDFEAGRVPEFFIS